MNSDDVGQVAELMRRYLNRFDIAPQFTNEEIHHWFLQNGNTKKSEKVVWAFDVDSNRITDVVSFYSLPSAVISNSHHKEINAAYLFYYASESAFATNNDQNKTLQARLQHLMTDTLILAKELGFDVFNALTLLDNPLFLEELKFGMGDGLLNYYLFNYRAKAIHGGTKGGGIIDRTRPSALIVCCRSLTVPSLRAATLTTESVCVRLVLAPTTAWFRFAGLSLTVRDVIRVKGIDAPVQMDGAVSTAMTDSACGALMPGGIDGVCYKGGLTVKENHQMCNVTNRKILDQLKEKLPQVTFSCNRELQQCNFQFWVDQIESFYCGLNSCTFEEDIQYNSNTTKYDCEKVQCKCVPDRLLCGEDGSIDISEFLTESIKGPGSFSCSSNDNSCRFEEPAMNDLIKSVFGDTSITLNCNSGECLHYTEVPGYQHPEKPSNTPLIAASLSGAIVLLIFLVLGLYKIMDLAYRFRQSQIPEEEVAKLMSTHEPATLSFKDISYAVASKQILSDVQGTVQHGQVMAIVGASGAGKTSFLDILARKNKRGLVTGKVLVNGAEISDSEFRKISGFVDQEDSLLPTLTVFETIMYSARLRLPRDMSLEAKRCRVLETMHELGILPIRDMMIGSEGARGISGGEKRRVSIACELVTSPSILFLDEPTSGLDSYNAFNVVENLVALARNYNRTVVFTIHQPRSNIVALFDHLLLLAHGKMVYSGDLSNCQSYFENIGFPCPAGFNIADYLVDLTMHAWHEKSQDSYMDNNQEGTEANASRSHLLAQDEQRLLASASRSDTALNDLETTSQLANSRVVQSNRERVEDNTSTGETNSLLSARFEALVEAYQSSDIFKKIKSDIHKEIDQHSTNQEMAPASRGYKRVGWLQQFSILSSRTFKNLYRNPMLMLTHYAIAVLLALLCGFLFFNVSNDISGFQNRLGLFFFILALFGFSTLSSLNIFAGERNLFVRERANGYYAPVNSLFKVLFDIIPLRVIPPIVMGLIIYPMVGLVPEVPEFFKFILVLVLFNLTAAAICLFIGIVFKELGVASLFGSLMMLFSLLFAGLLLNHDSIPPQALWLQSLSFFHYAFEALLVNEVRYLSLSEQKFGLSIEVPGATILSTFGFDVTAFWQDIIGLAIFEGVFVVLAYFALHFLLVEKR
ncbi:ABC transporter G family member [Neolecta irregularis DAH-3]|uniref:ABC transporter G family member n=1 Tax=Neolecta irregularis (strain DAH-3) TaxID=1198029 RepID=A0A1U7LPJ7_NEOID|nr:ABC transporter G family member [Neolecta irregularis DAH-3]|eukprot:OLL24559.1 ABC transporter G family member [Neolecta irregularis DAH-3]